MAIDMQYKALLLALCEAKKDNNWAQVVVVLNQIGELQSKYGVMTEVQA